MTTVPTCCHRCESRTVKRHCADKAASCTWVRCTKCGATSGYITRIVRDFYSNVTGTEAIRSHFGGIERGE